MVRGVAPRGSSNNNNGSWRPVAALFWTKSGGLIGRLTTRQTILCASFHSCSQGRSGMLGWHRAQKIGATVCHLDRMCLTIPIGSVQRSGQK